MDKTKEILDKYKKLLSGILGYEEKDIKFYSEQIIDEYSNDKKVEFKEIGELFYNKPNYQDSDEEMQTLYRNQTIVANFKLGSFQVKYKDLVISSWKLYEMPHCCAYMVSCNVNIHTAYRDKGIGTILNLLRIDIGKLLNYSAILCTDLKKNTAQRKILKNNKWTDIHSVVNKRTKNHLFLSVINL